MAASDRSGVHRMVVVNRENQLMSLHSTLEVGDLSMTRRCVIRVGDQREKSVFV